MLQPISIAQARNNFSDLLGEAYYGGRRFLIEKLGKPFAVVIGIEDYKQLEAARDYFFQKILAQRGKNKTISSSQVDKDVNQAISAIRKK